MADIEVRPDGVRVTARAGETVLAALFRSGYGYRVGCRRGGCAMCKVDLVDGQVDYPAVIADTVLSEDERRGGTCLSCRAVPRGDVVVQLRDERLKVVLPFLHATRRPDRGPTTT